MISGTCNVAAKLGAIILHARLTVYTHTRTNDPCFHRCNWSSVPIEFKLTNWLSNAHAYNTNGCLCKLAVTMLNNSKILRPQHVVSFTDRETIHSCPPTLPSHLSSSHPRMCKPPDETRLGISDTFNDKILIFNIRPSAIINVVSNIRKEVWKTC